MIAQENRHSLTSRSTKETKGDSKNDHLIGIKIVIGERHRGCQVEAEERWIAHISPRCQVRALRIGLQLSVMLGNHKYSPVSRLIFWPRIPTQQCGFGMIAATNAGV